MSQLIRHNDEFLRIHPKHSNRIEYSKNEGRTWSIRYMGTGAGDFLELISRGKELLATTSRGLFYSRNEGRTWSKRS